MVIEDPFYYYSPNSELESVDPGIIYIIDGGLSVEIKVNDWLDVLEGSIPEDPLWGSSYQVLSLAADLVEVKIFNKELNNYTSTFISPTYISNVFRHVAKS